MLFKAESRVTLYPD